MGRQHGGRNAAAVQRKDSLAVRMKKHWQLYILILPAVLYFAVFCYGPMYGIQLAFKNYNAMEGITGSPWVGFMNFERFFHSYQFAKLLKNTLYLSILQLLFGFPLPIVLALSLNYARSKKFKKMVQTITYAPHFISVVVLVGMLNIFFAVKGGLVNEIVTAFGFDPILFMGKERYFRPLFVGSGVWQNLGWNAIIYLAALSGVNPEMHEAAVTDGASKLQRVWHIDLPAIRPTIIILLILNCGQIMGLGFEKAFLMQNSLNLGSSEIIATYVYKIGLLDAQYGFATAVGLFNSIINFILLISVNKISKKVTETSLW